MELSQCSSCRIIEGGDLCQEILTDYRGHKICCWCKAEWEKREKQFKREISWEELLKGTGELKTESQLAKQRRNKAIRLELNKGKTIQEIGKQFNLHPRMLYRIVGGK